MASRFGGILVQQTGGSRFGGVAVEPQPVVATEQPKPFQSVDDVPGRRDVSFGEFIEPITTLARGAIAEPLAGVAGIVQGLNPFAGEDAAERAVEGTRAAITGQPESEFGKQILSETGELVEGIPDVGGAIGDVAFEATGSPTVAAAAASIPTAIGELLGLHGLRSLRSGTRLIDDVGRPTKQLRKALDSEGLDFDSLNPEVKQAIPQTMEPGLIAGSKPIGSEVDEVVKGQLKAGARDDALATKKLVDDKVVTDPVGTEAVKQGFREGFVQSVKTATPATKKKMLEMTRKMRSIGKSESLGVRTRPDDIVGEAVGERIKFIRDKADAARIELDDIATNKLSGVTVDGAAVNGTFNGILGDLDVGKVLQTDGSTKLDFTGSAIEFDPSAQKMIKNLDTILSTGKVDDALVLHKKKRQIDKMVDFRKKAPTGLTPEGEKAAKAVRRAINDSVRAVDTDYARVNDVLSETLGSMQDLDKATGTIDIFGKGSDKALGTKMRALLSNQQNRIKLENSLDQINETTKNLGGVFDDDIKDLVMFSDGLNAKFGTPAKTGFAGQIKEGVTAATTQAPKTTLVNAAGKLVGKGAEKVRGINDFNAFEAMEDLLK